MPSRPEGEKAQVDGCQEGYLVASVSRCDVQVYGSAAFVGAANVPIQWRGKRITTIAHPVDAYLVAGTDSHM